MLRLINILCHNNHFHKMPIFLTPAYFHSNFFSYLNQPNDSVYGHTLVNVPSTFPCLLYTLSISHILISSTRSCRTMSSLEIRNASSAVTNTNSFSELDRQYSCQYLGWVESYRRARSVWNIEWYLRKFIHLRFNGPITFSKSLNIPNKCNFSI